MYNNEVTYDKKWDTEENIRYQKKCMKILEPRARCMSDVPRAWAKEVYQLLNFINKKYGIQYDLSSFRGWRVDQRVFVLLVKKPFMSLTHNYNRVPDHLKKYYTKKPLHKKILSNIENAISNISQGISILYRDVIGSIYNKLRKPQVRIDQVKEKYGTLRVYCSASPEIEEEIDRLIKSLEVSLCYKDAYYSPKELYNWSTTRYDGDKKIETFPYRKFLKNN